MCNFREMTLQSIQNGGSKKSQTLKIWTYALKQVIWRFRICYYFREIFKFRDFMNTLRNLAKSVFAQFILTESPDHVL